MKKNLITASLFAIVIVLWLVSGALFKAPEVKLPSTADAAAEQSSPLVNVRVRQHSAESRTMARVLRGKTDSKRTARVSAELSGRVIARPVERGQAVKAGDLLCELAVDDRAVNVTEAKAKLTQAEIEYQGALELQERQLLSEIQIAQRKAELESARAELARMELDLARTQIRAPFDGVIETLPMVVGDFASIGAECATLIDLDPLLITANIAERDINLIAIGNPVTGQTSTNEVLDGTVTFVGSLSDPTTRTYPVEITVANPDNRVRAGLTTIVSVEAETVMAHRVSPALLTLDDDGVIGLRAVDADDRVVFHPVDIIEDAVDGAWVTGLPPLVDLITVGQEFVSAGQLVEVVRDVLPGSLTGE